MIDDSFVKEHIISVVMLIHSLGFWGGATLMFIVSRLVTKTNVLLYLYLLLKLEELYVTAKHYGAEWIKSVWDKQSNFIIMGLCVIVAMLLFKGISRYTFLKKR